jgi:hypothetical protein
MEEDDLYEWLEMPVKHRHQPVVSPKIVCGWPLAEPVKKPPKRKVMIGKLPEHAYVDFLVEYKEEEARLKSLREKMERLRAEGKDPWDE